MKKEFIEPTDQDIKFLDSTNYTIDKCKVDFKDLIVNKPWGYEYLLFENRFCAIWILNIDYMQNTSMHCHVNKETSLICLDGQVSSNTLEKNNILNPLDGLIFGKKVFHQTNAISQDGASILEIESPVNKFDLVRINDQYGRRGKEYEDKKCYQKEENLTLSPTNCTKNIGDMILQIKYIDSIDELKIYKGNTLISFLDNNDNCGKIQTIENINYIKNRSLVLIIKEKN